MQLKEQIKQLASEEIQDFIISHFQDDVPSLALKYKHVGGIPFPEIGIQLINRYKAKNKLPKWFNTRGIVYPPNVSMEQCSSEATGLYKSNLIPESSSIADFTGGFGIDSYFFSTKASYVKYIERQENLCIIAEHNFEVLEVNNIKVYHTNLEDYIQSWLNSPTDYIYIDPARRDSNQKKVFKLKDCEPDLAVLLPLVLPHCHGVMAKLSPLFDVHLLLKEWGNVIQHIHIVSIKNECKELLVVFTREPEEGGITCINLDQNQKTQTCSYQQFKNPVSIEYSLPQKYLYEPNSSIMKAGMYDIVGNNFQLKKLNINSHLYTSEKLVTDFPGRRFIIKNVVAVDKKDLCASIPGKKANFSTRNFPLSPEELLIKMGFKTGGEYYVFGTTLLDTSKALIVCEKAP